MKSYNVPSSRWRQWSPAFELLAQFASHITIEGNSKKAIYQKIDELERLVKDQGEKGYLTPSEMSCIGGGKSRRDNDPAEEMPGLCPAGPSLAARLAANDEEHRMWLRSMRAQLEELERMQNY